MILSIFIVYQTYIVSDILSSFAREVLVIFYLTTNSKGYK